MLFYGLRKWYMLGLMKPFQTPPDKLQKMHLGYAVNKAVKGADTMRVFKYRHSLIQATTIYSSPNIIDVFKHPHNNCEVEIDANKAFPDTLTVRNHTTLRYCVGRTPANRDVALLPSQPSLYIAMATPSRLKSKLVVSGKWKALCISFLLLSSLYHPLLLFLPDAPLSLSLPLSAGNRCPPSRHKYLLITIAGDSWSTQMDNLWVHIRFSHTHTTRAEDRWAFSGWEWQITLRFSRAAWWKHLGYKMSDHRRGEDEGKGGKRIRIKERRRRKERKSQRVSEGRMGVESNISFAKKNKKTVWCRLMNSYQCLTIYVRP